VVLGLTGIILVILTIFLIAFTPLKEYIPGYMDVDLQRKVYELQLRADSIEQEFARKTLYFENLKKIIEGRETTEYYQDLNDSIETKDPAINYADIRLTHTQEDSLFRLEYEQRGKYDNYRSSLPSDLSSTYSRSNFLFFPPLQGIVTSRFDPEIDHFGVDIVADRNEPIKAALDGMVILSGWTIETGNVIAIQHTQNILSVYKHNSVLLKKEGTFVKAGEVIAIIGETGELSTGPHLHFELWFNGNPVDPTEYISF
jgi:murein DD-endopeptidase MepM/ murein hydrolase activator NlpD